jgi:nucleotide-binding universal stress UspA family protein
VIVAGYDGSLQAQYALRKAAALLSPRRILIVTVWEPGLGMATAFVPTGADSPAVPLDPAVAMEVDEAMDKRAHTTAEEGAELARQFGLEPEIVVVPDEGNVADTLVDLANERGAEAIVVGSRGLGGLRARLLGSVSEKVTRHAAIPVLVVHAPPDHP